MLIIGCDFHPGFQQVAIFDNQTGEQQERRLGHRAEAEQFYRALAGQQVRVGMEACGHYPWFERLLAELGFELWLGDAAEIRARVVRKQKTDRRDAEHLLQLLRQDRFPRIWVPSLEERDVRQLLVHRHKQVQARTRVKNQLQAMALSQGVQKKRKLWTEAGRPELEKLELLPYAAERRKQLLAGAGWIGNGDRATEPAGGTGSWKTAGGGEVADPSGSGTGDGVGHGVDAGSGRAVRFRQAGGELLRIDSERVLQRRPAAVGAHQQTGQFVSASCWWKRDSRRRATTLSWAASTVAWRCANLVRWPKWRWRASWR
jgi:hypothetical protein